MKTFLRSSPIFLLLAAALGAVADAPRVARPLLRSVEKSLDERIARMERDQVFGGNWIAIGRTDQVAAPGQFLTFDLVGSTEVET